MKNILLSLSILTIVGFAACKKSNNPPPNDAHIMYVNGCAGTSNVNVTSNATAVPAATNMAFLKNSGYQGLTAGNDSIAFVLTNLGTPLKGGTTNFAANTYYSVFVGGLVTGPAFVVTTDDLSVPTSGNAKIRLVNLSSDALSETGNAGSIAFATGVTAETFSSFTEVAAGSYNIKAGDPSNISTVVGLGTGATQLSAGKIYTVMLTGTLSGSGNSGLTLTLINNN